MDAQLLLVDDDPVVIRVLARALRNEGAIRFATNGEDAVRLARESVPDLILLDADLPGMSGFEVCATLKSDPAFADVPIIFVTSHASLAFELDGFAAGAADFISKPVSEPLLRARVRTQLRVKQLTDQLRTLSNTDALTTVANRRRFDSVLAEEWQRALRGEPMALLMIDVDHFKAYNDRYGHPAGDVCLRAVAGALREASQRTSDLVARVGGEEFAIVLPQTSIQGAAGVARRAARALRSLSVPHDASSCSSVVTVSVGVAGFSAPIGSGATMREGGTSFQHESLGQRLLQGADRALYAAKQAGRNGIWYTDLSADRPTALTVDEILGDDDPSMPGRLRSDATSLVGGAV